MNNKDFRLIAENQLKSEVALNKEELAKLSLDEISLIVHELQVHQIELYMQNQELLKTQVELDETKTRYFDLYDLAPEGYLVISEKGLILETNLTAATMLGVARTILNKQRLSQYIYKEDHDRYYLHRKELFTSNEPQECEIRMIRQDGTIFWAHMVETVVMKEGSTTCSLILGDISKRKQSEQDLQNSEEKYKSLVMSMEQGLGLHEIICDANGKPVDYIFLDINESYTRLLGITRDMCIGKRIKEVMPDVEQYWIDVFGKVALTGEPNYYENILAKTGRYYSTYTYSPKNNQFAVLVADIDDRVRREEQINYLNYHDQLTGLYNRRFYEEELKRLDTERNLPLTIAIGDINGLKLINDSFGHQVGDQQLKKAAEVIKGCFRADDIIARMGGDEFVIILPNTDTTEAEKLISRISNFSAKSKVQNLDVSISFGYETKTKKAQKIEDIFKSAEDHMYRHKLYESASIKNKMIEIIMNTLFEKNARELLHSKRVSETCEFIAECCNMSHDDILEAKLAGLMHDIGKIGIDENALNSIGKLNDEEWKEIKRHSEVGYRILSSSNEFSEIANHVLGHHERWDGAGYPKGLKGEEISVLARIIAIADAFDAMTNERTYKQALSVEGALEEITRCAGAQFDPEIAKVFVLRFKERYKNVN